MPTADFTAVADNLQKNLDRLAVQLRDELALPPSQRVLGLSDDEVALPPSQRVPGLSDKELTAALEALDTRALSLEIRLGPGTKLGSFTSGDVIRNIKKAWADAGVRSRVPVEVKTIDQKLMDEAAVTLQDAFKRDAIGSRPRFTLSRPWRRAAASSRAPSGPPRGMSSRTHGPMATMRTVSQAELTGEGKRRLAREIVDKLSFPAPRAVAPGQGPVHVLLDTSALSPQARKDLRRAIET